MDSVSSQQADAALKALGKEVLAELEKI